MSTWLGVGMEERGYPECHCSPIFGGLSGGCHQHHSIPLSSSGAELGLYDVLRVCRSCSSRHMTIPGRLNPIRKPLSLDPESQKQASTETLLGQIRYSWLESRMLADTKRFSCQGCRQSLSPKKTSSVGLQRFHAWPGVGLRPFSRNQDSAYKIQ